MTKVNVSRVDLGEGAGEKPGRVVTRWSLSGAWRVNLGTGITVRRNQPPRNRSGEGPGAQDISAVRSGQFTVGLRLVAFQRYPRCRAMTGRPYFHYGVEELERLFAAAHNDPVLLGALRRELEHRTVPKARALRTQVDEALLKVGSSRSPSRAPAVSLAQQVSVGCAQCRRANLVSVSVGGAAQHFSCAGCFRPFVIEFENGTMKVSYPPLLAASGNRLWIGVVLAAATLAGLYLFLIART